MKRVQINVNGKLAAVFQLAFFVCLVGCFALNSVFAQGVATNSETAEAGEKSSVQETPLVAASSDGEVDQFINRAIKRKYKQAEITPAKPCDEATFVRRAYLDLAGRIPTYQEAQTYLADQREDKRSHLIRLLVQSEDYVQHFADIFDTLLMGRASRSAYEQRQANQWRAFLERVFRDNRPWNDVVREILLARPGNQDERGSVWFLYERKEKPQDIAEAIAPAFFGIRIECAQCHDHMVADEIKQAHYWGLVAFFNRGKNVKSKNGPRVAETAIGGFSEFAGLDGESSPNLLTFFRSPTVEEARPKNDDKQKDNDDLYVPASLSGDPRVPKFSRREKFVDQIVDDHPLLARAFVNRVWAILMGRGLVHPFDEMDSQHPPSHPELLDELAKRFRESNYDIRQLVTMIALNDAYQLDSRKPKGIEDPATFAWYLDRPLTAEQYARSVQLALHGEFKNDHAIVADFRDRLRDVLPDQATTTIKDALFLTNNSALNSAIESSDKDSHLIGRLLKLNSHDDRAKLLIESTFIRMGTPEEQQAIAAYLSRGDNMKSRLQQVLWSLLTSAEFRLNH